MMIRNYIKFKFGHNLVKYGYGKILQEVERLHCDDDIDELRFHYLVQMIDNPLDYDHTKIMESYQIKIVSPYDILMVYGNSKVMKKELSAEDDFELFNDRPTKDD